jgi:hypothetical protein
MARLVITVKAAAAVAVVPKKVLLDTLLSIYKLLFFGTKKLTEFGGSLIRCKDNNKIAHGIFLTKFNFEQKQAG